jgi:serpin B
VLVNTIYWKADWARQFDETQTEPGAFQEIGGEEARLPLMHQQAPFQAFECDGIEAILLPYQGGELEMAVFLPSSATGLPRFEADLTSKGLSDWFAQLEAAPSRNTVLTLPKMRLGWSEDLVPIFKRMGTEVPFGLDADFSAIATPEDKGVLGIGAIVHKTDLDVDEHGSEAAAATAMLPINLTSGGAGPPPPPPFVFQADHPFFFVLRERRTGLICFMARFATAEETSSWGSRPTHPRRHVWSASLGREIDSHLLEIAVLKRSSATGQPGPLASSLLSQNCHSDLS